MYHHCVGRAPSARIGHPPNSAPELELWGASGSSRSDTRNREFANYTKWGFRDAGWLDVANVALRRMGGDP